MMHKKKPILLISIVGSLGLILLGLNMSQYLRNQDRYEDIPAPNELTRGKFGERPIDRVGNGDAIIDEMDKAIQSDSGMLVATIADVPDRPSIILPSLKLIDEQYPGGNTPSPGWYTKNSRQQTEDETRRKAAGQSD